MKSSVSEKLSLLRRETGRSQRAAAQDLGVSQALLSHYENGAREPKLEFVVRACDYYGVSADYFLGRSEKPLDGDVTLKCGSDVEFKLAQALQDINIRLYNINDCELTEAAVCYLSAAVEKIAGLLSDPYVAYDPMRDARMKIAEASFLSNVRRAQSKR